MSIDERFREFHRDNPHVYAKLVSLARAARKRHKNIGIELLYAVCRWQTMMQTTDTDFKLNDHYTSRYARLIMEQEHDLAGFFRTRELRS